MSKILLIVRQATATKIKRHIPAAVRNDRKSGTNVEIIIRNVDDTFILDNNVMLIKILIIDEIETRIDIAINMKDVLGYRITKGEK